MSLPVPQLDDRRFDDLVAELRARAASHLPEWRPVPGDPGSALLDLVAWMGEAVIYRLNLIPERQRLAFLNLLHVPLRPARPARGVVGIDPGELAVGGVLPAVSVLKAGKVSLLTEGELTPLPLTMAVVVKEPAAELAAKGANEGRQYFRPRTVLPGRERLSLSAAVDGHLHLAFAVGGKVKAEDRAAVRQRLRQELAGRTLNLGVVPDRMTLDAAPASTLAPRRLIVELAQGIADPGENDPAARQATAWWPLDVIADSSDGARIAGVLRLRLPQDVAQFVPAAEDLEDVEFAGQGDAPPEAPVHLPGPLLFWLRLRCPEDPTLALGWLGVNGVEVAAQERFLPRIVGVGTGEADQAVALGSAGVDAGSLVLEVQEPGGWRPWRAVPHFGGRTGDDRAYVLDAYAGTVRFGDGVRGRRPGRGERIRAGFRSGGGAAGNLPAGSVKEVVGGPRGLKVRQEWPLEGGADAEGVAQAERRIPEFLNHRDRAVTPDDFRALALSHPAVAVARAEVRPGLLPVPGPATGRRDVPGVVSVLILPPAPLSPGAPPRPTQGLLADMFAWLKPRTLIGTELYVLAPEFVPVAAALSVRVEDPRSERSVLAAVERTVAEWLFALPPGGLRGEGWPLGRSVDAEEIEARAARVPGVLAVGTVRLWRGSAAGWQEAGGGRIDLNDWQLPDLQAVSAQPGDGQPQPPAPLSAAPTDGVLIAPAPLLPDLC